MDKEPYNFGSGGVNPRSGIGPQLATTVIVRSALDMAALGDDVDEVISNTLTILAAVAFSFDLEEMARAVDRQIKALAERAKTAQEQLVSPAVAKETVFSLEVLCGLLGHYAKRHLPAVDFVGYAE